MILIPVWTFFLLGAKHGGAGAWATAPILRLLAGLVSITAAIGAVYVVNQIADRESDLRNDKLFLIPRGIVPMRAAWIETAVLAALSIALGAVFLPWGFTALMIGGMALGAAYSLEPVRLKRRAFWDVAANALWNGLMNTLAGWIAAGGSLERWPLLLPYPLAVAAVHLATTLADIEGDRACGFNTSGMELGVGFGLGLSTALMTASAVVAYLVGNNFAMGAALFSLLVFVNASRHGSGDDAARVLLPAKGATALFALAACVAFPLFLPALAIVVWLTRVYYRRRFGIAYPSF